MRRMVPVLALVNIDMMFGIDVLFLGEVGPSLMADTSSMERYTLLASLLLKMLRRTLPTTPGLHRCY